MARRLPTNIQAGELRHRIKLVQPSSQDSMGGVSPQDRSQWSVVRDCWAQIETWNGDSQLATGSFVATVSHWITIRHPRTTVPNTRMLVWFGNRTFQITAVLNPTEQNKLLVLSVLEVNDSIQQS